MSSNDENLIEVRFKNGTVSGVEDVVEVSVGEKITIRVTSDVEEEIHVHGYDKSAPVSAGSPALITFTANIPGAFEVELEESATELFELRVQ